MPRVSIFAAHLAGFGGQEMFQGPEDVLNPMTAFPST
jgi:hypothetical protein